MSEMIKVDVLVWFNNEKGQEVMRSFEQRLFVRDLDWVCEQYAEVNKGICKICDSEKLLVSYDKRI